MKSLRELGVALSFVFGVFFLALLAELGYIFYWKNRRQPSGSTTPMPPLSKTIMDDIKQLNMNVMSKLPGVNSSFNYFIPKQASEPPLPPQLPPVPMPPSFIDGYNSYPDTATAYKCLLSSFNININPSVGYEFDHAAYATAAGFLFPIKEETKEELEQLDTCSLCSYDSNSKQNARLRNRTPSDVLTIPFTMSSGTSSSGSSSPIPGDASEETSINMVEFEHKILLPYNKEDTPMGDDIPHIADPLASKGSFMMFGGVKCGPESVAGMTNSPRAVQQPWSMSPSMHRTSTTLKLLFENSPVLGPGFEPSYSSYVRQKQQQQQKQIMDGLQPCAVSDRPHLSLGALFQMPPPPPPVAPTAATGTSSKLPT